jgi:hypothetical protein
MKSVSISDIFKIASFFEEDEKVYIFEVFFNTSIFSKIYFFNIESNVQ